MQASAGSRVLMVSFDSAPAPPDASRYAATAKCADRPDAAPSRARATDEQERAKAKAESTRRERDRALTGTAQLCY